VSYDKDAEDMVLAAALFRFGEMDFTAALARVNGLSASERLNLRLPRCWENWIRP